MSRSAHWPYRLAALGILFSFDALVPTVVAGQSFDAIPANTRVRVDFLIAKKSRFHRERVQSLVGTLETTCADTLLLVVRTDALPLRIPRAAIGTLYVSGGHPPRWRAALDGAVLPALVTAALSAAGASIHRKAGQPSPAQMAASSAAWVAASGAVLGAWSPKERWRRVSRPDSVATYASPVRDR